MPIKLPPNLLQSIDRIRRRLRQKAALHVWEELDDALGEAVARYLHKAPEDVMRSEAATFSWLQTATERVLVDRSRSTPRVERTDSASEGPCEPLQERPVFPVCYASIDWDLLVHLLPASQSKVLLLHVQGYQSDEIAMALRVSKEAVRKRLSRARERAKELLEL
jgi:DNA-directed RNA polymerase specialized sigma24 family protein